MRKALLVACLVAVALTMTLVISAAAGNAPTIVPADSLKWTPVKGLPGALVAIVWGDPTKAAPYIERFKVRNGVTFPPHWHPQDERVTVLSGTLMFAAGDKVNRSKMTAVHAGGFIFIPHGVHHYGIASGPSEFQVSGMGPDIMNFVK